MRGIVAIRPWACRRLKHWPILALAFFGLSAHEHSRSVVFCCALMPQRSPPQHFGSPCNMVTKGSTVDAGSTNADSCTIGGRHQLSCPQAWVRKSLRIAPCFPAAERCVERRIDGLTVANVLPYEAKQAGAG